MHGFRVCAKSIIKCRDVDFEIEEIEILGLKYMIRRRMFLA